MPASSHNPWAAAAAVAAQQWGCITTPQLRRCGCALVATAVAAGRLHRVHEGVYALGTPAVTPHARAMAAVLSAGPGALLSHAWALWLWDLGRLPSGRVRVTTPSGRSGRTDVHLHRTRHPDPDCTYGIPVTSPARTLADCAPALSAKALRRAVNQAQINHLTQREPLMEQPRLRALVNNHGATRSILEELLSDLAHHHLPKPHVNEIVHGVEVDFHYPELRLVVEADGWSFHWTRIAFEDDQVKRRRATADRLATIIRAARPG